MSIAVVVTLALTGAMLSLRHVTAQQPACLHGQNEAPDQVARRQAALGLTRQINTRQSSTFRLARAYQPLALPVGATPTGFAVQLTTDGTSYAFSVKDTLDSCGFGYFSDQDGVIYVGEGLR
jgi:hypothetical protein